MKKRRKNYVVRTTPKMGLVMTPKVDLGNEFLNNVVRNLPALNNALLDAALAGVEVNLDHMWCNYPTGVKARMYGVAFPEHLLPPIPDA